MKKRGNARRPARGKKSRNRAKRRSIRSASESSGTGLADGSQIAQGEDDQGSLMTPIERIFLEEVGREMKPEERRILLGIRRTRRTST